MPFPTEQRCIIRAEEALGRRFPESYAARMLRSNGGAVEVDDDEWTLHPVRDDSDRKRLARSSNDVVTAMSAAGTWKGFPDSEVAIGANSSGDLLVWWQLAQTTLAKRCSSGNTKPDRHATSLRVSPP